MAYNHPDLDSMETKWSAQGDLVWFMNKSRSLETFDVEKMKEILVFDQGLGEKAKLNPNFTKDKR